MSALFKPGFINLCHLWIAMQFDLFSISLYFTHSLDSNSWQLELVHSQSSDFNIFEKCFAFNNKTKKHDNGFIFSSLYAFPAAKSAFPAAKSKQAPEISNMIQSLISRMNLLEHRSLSKVQLILLKAFQTSR